MNSQAERSTPKCPVLLVYCTLFLSLSLSLSPSLSPCKWPIVSWPAEGTVAFMDVCSEREREKEEEIKKT